MKFFGITRFNLVTRKTLRSFRATKNKTLAAAKNEIYNEANLRSRLELFKALCLPTYTMLARESPDSYGLILINKDLPIKIKQELEELCLNIPRLLLIELGDHEGIDEVIKPVILDLSHKDDRVFTYRYDDDDALSIDFLSQIEQVSLGVDIDTVVSFRYGYYLSRINDENYTLYVRNYPLNACGLGLISYLDNFKTIFELGSHTQIKEPVVLIEDVLGWLSTQHAHNDSKIGKARQKLLTKEIVIDTISEKFPHIDTEILSKLTFRRDEDSEFTIKTFHGTYLAYDSETNQVIQVKSFGANANIYPIFINKFDCSLFVEIDSKKMIFENIYGETVSFLDKNNNNKKYIISIMDKTPKLSIEVDEKYLSARKSSENIFFKLQPICQAWEFFKME